MRLAGLGDGVLTAGLYFEVDTAFRQGVHETSQPRARYLMVGCPRHEERKALQLSETADHAGEEVERCHHVCVPPAVVMTAGSESQRSDIRAISGGVELPA
jgi:hypothetical protein